MLLTIDAGNTSISFGVFDKDKLIKKFSLTSDKKRSVDEYGVLISSIIKQNNIGKNALKTCIMASVVPTLTDILEMDAASNNKVENVREIREKIQYPPVSGKYKVYIIDEVHMLSIGAFNALLKTLEEPP